MSIGGRRAKTTFTPPVPVPPPPPSAYGLTVPGAAPVPQQQSQPGPPPATVPVPPPPAGPLAAADPSGFFGGPAPAAPSSFGAFGQPAPPAQSQFGSYGQTATVAPGGFGRPSPQPAPPAVGRRKPVKALAGAGVAVVLLGLLAVPRVMDQLHRHHTTTLPAAMDSYTQLDSAAEAAISSRLQSSLPSKFEGKLTHLQAAVYVQGTAPALFVATGDVPAGSQRHPDVAFQNDDGTDDFHDVVAPASGFGGKVRCTTFTEGSSSMQACGWIDDGTFGLVMAMSADEPTTIQLLGEVRSAVER